MLSYELCLKLKDAGLNQSLGPDLAYVEGGIVTSWDNDCACWREEPISCIVPTLSELIEACGDKFEKLERARMFDGKKNRLQPWSAFTQEEKGFYKNVAFGGNSPEEAVANLYLKLHAKEN